MRDATLTADLWQTIGTKILTDEKITPDSEVCVVRSAAAQPEVAEVAASAARSRGASVSIHEYPSFETWRSTFDLPDPLHAAVTACDVLISHPYLSAAQFQWSNSVFSALVDHGVSHISMSPSAEVLAGPAMQWPHDLALTVGGTISDMMFCKQREVRVTDDRGTDVTFTGIQELTHPIWFSGLREVQPELGFDEGEWGDTLTFYPTGEVGWHPNGTADGTFYIDAIDGYGVLDEPMCWTIEDGVITDVSGGHAAHFEAKLDEHSPDGCRHHVIEASFGFNPKCAWNPQRRGTAGLLPKAGTFHFATGMATSKLVHEDAAPTHIDALNRAPTVTVDGETIIEDGELLLLAELRENETVREVAREYGDPDSLLTPGVTDW